MGFIRMLPHVRRVLRVGGLASALCFGCGEDVVIQGGATTETTAAGGQVAPGAPVAVAPGTLEAPLPPVSFQEEDFSENDRSRDPFRSFEDMFLEKSDRRTFQRAKVLLETFSLDQLKLIGVVTGINPAKAMLEDSAGIGHVVQRNDLVGKAERVQAGGGSEEFEINWRVDRIRDSDVVFVREDPANPDVPSATRVLSLHVEGENAQP
jgi:type IV pilus assembly protein PilP